MTAGSDSERAVAGGLARHIPVLVRPAVDLLAARAGGVYVDATFGAGGYARAILAAANCTVIGIDRDPSAVARGADLVEAAGGRLVLVEGTFSDLEAIARDRGHDAVDGVVFDVGVSSLQLETAERGFSFRRDGPLDMRMGREGPTAADIVAAASERDLAAIFATLGEERRARAVARAIVAARRAAPIRTTHALAEIVAGVVAARPGVIHPATRTFQALRIFVNDELAELAAGLAAAERLLKPGGRLAIVTFHSLEDRIAKSFLAERSGRRGSSRHHPQAGQADATFRVLTKRPIVPDAAEIDANPRARSAKLRAAERTGAPAAARAAAAPLPRLPSVADIVGAAGIGAAAMMRILNICVIAALVLAAADVYKIKFESTRQAQRVAKLRMEIRREHDAIAALRAEWAKLDNPARIQGLVRRHLALQPTETRQFDGLDNLPERLPEAAPAGQPDSIEALVAKPQAPDRSATGSLPAAKR